MSTAGRKTTRDEADAILQRAQASEIAAAQVERPIARAAPPISVRLSAPLLERLDRIAEREHRKRGNLIQHILWEYVRRHEGM